MPIYYFTASGAERGLPVLKRPLMTTNQVDGTARHNFKLNHKENQVQRCSQNQFYANFICMSVAAHPSGCDENTVSVQPKKP